MPLTTRISSRQPRRALAPRRIRVRKAPRQDRAQITVEALLQATAELLDERGYGALTTNHVAQRAGVSIGSLYQYFPGKEALCHALAERHFQRYAQLYVERLATLARAPVETQVRELVRLNFEIARQEPQMARGLYSELARIGGLDPLQRMRAAIMESLDARYRVLAVPYAQPHPEMIAFIITIACSALVGETVMRKPQWLDDAEFIEHIIQMILGYYDRLGWLPKES